MVAVFTVNSGSSNLPKLKKEIVPVIINNIRIKEVTVLLVMEYCANEATIKTRLPFISTLYTLFLGNSRKFYQIFFIVIEDL